MSYMGEYVMWCMENGIPLDAPMRAEDVARYHKENPHMIPKPRETKETLVKRNIESIAKAAEVLGWDKDEDS